MTTERRGFFYEELEVGRADETAQRTVRIDDINAFAQLSADHNRLHLDDAYAQSMGFNGRIAHGVLGLSVVTGLLGELGLTRGTLIAFLGLTWRFEKPVYPGDTIRARTRVASKRLTSKDDRGVVNLEITVVNQHGDTVQNGEFTLLVRRK